MNYFEKFQEVWIEEIEKIENAVIDDRGSRFIYNRFRMDESTVRERMKHSDSSWEVDLNIELLRSRLVVALETARTKYMLQSRSLWVKFTESIAGLFRGFQKI